MNDKIFNFFVQVSKLQYWMTFQISKKQEKHNKLIIKYDT